MENSTSMELYLDCAATTKVDEAVLKEYVDLITNTFGSTGSLHQLGVNSLSMETLAKEKIARLLKVKPSEILFNSGATEGNNYAIKGVAFQYKNRGKTIITSKIEHPSVLECFHQLEKDFGFNCIYLDVDEYGRIDLNQLKNCLNNDVILVSIMYVNHEVGSIQPIKEIRNLISKYPKVIFHSDITQAIGKMKVDLSLVDIATMSGHKIHGLKGTGFIYKKDKITLYDLYNGHPANNALRAGTSNFAGNISLAKALEVTLNHLNEDAISMKEAQRYLIESLNGIEGIEVNTNPTYCISGIVNFSPLGYNPEVLIRALSIRGISVSSRSACSVAIKDRASATLKAMHKDVNNSASSIRVSYDRVLSNDEIDYFITNLKEVLKEIRK